MTKLPSAEIAPSGSVSDAQAAIASFEKSVLPGLWPHLDKATIVAEMRSRVDNPYKVDQGQQPFCGPASVLFELIRKHPLRYVQICRQLFEVGCFQAKTRQVEASSRLRNSSKGNLRMGQADWMILATLRESENLIFPVEPNAPDLVRGLGGMTKSWEMKGWVREVLGYSQVQYDHTYLWGDLNALAKAANLVAAGGVAFALVTAEGMLGKTTPTRADMPIAYPNHWIVLLGNVQIQKGTSGKNNSGHVSFDVYSWARKMQVEMDQAPFERFMWGIVTGQP